MEVISSIYNSGYNIKKFYLGSRELNLAYLGNQVIYDEVIGDNDLNYILYEFYGSDTLPNTVEAPVKSAILYGNTLLNNVDLSKATLSNNNKITEDGYIIAYGNGNWSNAFIGQRQMEANTKYLCAVFVYENTLNSGSFGYLSDWQDSEAFIIDANASYEFNTGEIGTKIFTMTTKKNLKDSQYSFRAFLGAESTSGYVKFRVVAIKYEDYMENWNIDYFKDFGGSVKMPVLTASNKYTFCDFEIVPNSGDNVAIETYKDDRSVTLKATGRWARIRYNVKHDNNVSYNLKFDYNATNNFVIDFNGFTSSRVTINSGTGSFSYDFIAKNNEIIHFAFPGGGTVEITNIEFGLSELKDEPYKSNILTVNEDVTLRSNGDIYDELNLLTGQLTQRIDEDGEILTQEVVKTVDLTIVDQDGKTINKLNSFNGTTHVSTEVAENSAYPMVSLEVASELQAAMSKVAEDIELIKPVQNDIETTIDTQSNDIDSLLLATTELFEMFL